MNHPWLTIAASVGLRRRSGGPNWHFRRPPGAPPASGAPSGRGRRGAGLATSNRCRSRHRGYPPAAVRAVPLWRERLRRQPRSCQRKQRPRAFGGRPCGIADKRESQPRAVRLAFEPDDFGQIAALKAGSEAVLWYISTEFADSGRVPAMQFWQNACACSPSSPSHRWTRRRRDEVSCVSSLSPSSKTPVGPRRPAKLEALAVTIRWASSTLPTSWSISVPLNVSSGSRPGKTRNEYVSPGRDSIADLRAE